LDTDTHTIKKNTEVLVVTSKGIGLEVNAKKAKYMSMSQDQNAGQIHNIKIDNKSLERVEWLKYFITTMTNQNSIQEEIKTRLKSGNSSCHLMQNFCLAVCSPKM